jgi:arginine/ornithine N-succinyltransferase beta subunit
LFVTLFLQDSLTGAVQMMSLFLANLRRENSKRNQSGSVSIVVIFAFAALFSAIGLAVTGGEIIAGLRRCPTWELLFA